MNMSSQGFLDDFAKMILAHCSTAVDNLLPPVLGLMAVMLMWNIITNWDLYWGKQDYSKLIPLLVTATFFVFLANSWGFVLDTVYQFGSEVAITASNNKGTIDDNKFLTTVTPSMIVNEGIDNAIIVFKGHVFLEKPIEAGENNDEKEEVARKIAASMKAGITGNVISGLFYAFITLLLFGFIAISYLYTVLEFFIIGSLSMALLPFGLLDRTKAIVDKILNYFFVSAIRIAIFLFLVLLINPTIKNAFKNASFDESVIVEKGEEYFVVFSSSDLQEDESLQFYYDSQGNQQGDLEIIDEEIDGTMIVRTFTFCFDSETFIVVMGFALYLAVFFRILYKLFS